MVVVWPFPFPRDSLVHRLGLPTTRPRHRKPRSRAPTRPTAPRSETPSVANALFLDPPASPAEASSHVLCGDRECEKVSPPRLLHNVITTARAGNPSKFGLHELCQQGVLALVLSDCSGLAVRSHWREPRDWSRNERREAATATERRKAGRVVSPVCRKTKLQARPDCCHRLGCQSP